MSGYDKNNFFNRYAVKYQFTNLIKARFYSYPGMKSSSDDDESDEQESDEDIFDANKAYPDSIDTFGVDEAPSKGVLTRSKAGKKENVASPNKMVLSKASAVSSNTAENHPKELLDDSVCSDSDSSETSLKIDLDDEDSGSKSGPSGLESPPKKKKTDSNEGKQQTSLSFDATKPARIQEPNILSNILMEQEKLIQKNSKKASKKSKESGNKEDPRLYLQPEGNNNASYKTWLLKGNQKSCRLLVRTSVDTAIVSNLQHRLLFQADTFKMFFFSYKVTPSGEVRTFLMAAKSEYQPWFGSECLTPQELFETWIDMHLRPGTRLFRGFKFNYFKLLSKIKLIFLF